MAGVIEKYQLRSIDAFIVSAHGEPREMTLSERNILFAYAQAAVTEIETIWPVDTSTSRDGWTFTVSGRAGDVHIEIENLVDYVEWVHAAGDPTPLVDEAVPEIVDRWIDQLIPELKREILRTEADIAADLARGGRGFLDIFQRRPATSLDNLVERVLRG